MEHSGKKIKNDLISDLTTATSIDSIKELHIKYLGRKGLINGLFAQLKLVSDETKKSYGDSVNELKKYIEHAIAEKEAAILGADTTANVDVTLPGLKPTKGSLHIVTYAIEEITDIFSRLGFIRMRYPEVEWEYYSFEALNMPPGHPARDDFETFFIDEKISDKFGRMLLTPHTSNGQIHEMLRVKNPPIKMINIARTYRPNWDASHVPMFHQFECLCIDEGINMTNLKGTIEYFATAFFGADRKIRLRPFHFQFTEPSFEVDITCGICDGTGVVHPSVIARSDNDEAIPLRLPRSARNYKSVRCKLCKSGWLELGGTGMVHRNVLKSGGIDHTKYTGWAFGFGVERVMMMKQGLKLDDIRVLYNGDIRFLEQF